jgi:hypothetical protein
MQRLIGIFFLCLFISLHALFANFIAPIDVTRTMASIALFALMIYISANFAKILLAIQCEHLKGALKTLFIMMCIAGAVGATKWGPPTLTELWRSPVFPFSEPSHFALIFTPLLIYMCVNAKYSSRFFLLLLACALAVLIKNLTLGCGVILTALLTLRLSNIMWILLAGVIILIFGPVIEIPYIWDRINLDNSSKNLSNLVYLQGWQMILESWWSSNGWGLGFQQLGVRGTEVEAAESIRALIGTDTNLLDGSFLAAKLGSEFGFFSIFLICYLVFLGLRYGIALRNFAFHKLALSPAISLAYSILLAFLIEIFVRSSGYFTGSGFLMCAALWLIYFSRRYSVRNV